MADTKEPEADTELGTDELDGVSGGNPPLGQDGAHGSSSTEGGHFGAVVDHGRK
jgi:hypothetical protein